MSGLFWFLLLLAPVVAIGYVVWAYRQKTAGRDAASRERYATLVEASRGAAAPAGAARSDQGAPALAAAASPGTRQPKARERFLGQPETLLYYVLKAGLPEHEVFPRVGLAAVLDAPDTRSTPALQRLDLDFLVCDKSMRAVAAVLLDGRVAGPVVDVMRQSLSGVGIRLVRVNPAALPKRDQVKALVLGSERPG
jgi:hypothetical protein